MLSATAGGGSSLYLITDMSEGGLCLTSGHAHQVGEEVTVKWSLGASSPQFEALCSVRHATATQAGVEFLNITTAERERVRDFLRTPRTE